MKKLILFSFIIIFQILPGPAAHGEILVSFTEEDEREGAEEGYHFIQLLVNESVAWESDIGTNGTIMETVDVTEFFEAEGEDRVKFRLFEKKGVGNFKIRATIIDVAIQQDGQSLDPGSWSFSSTVEGCSGKQAGSYFQLSIGWRVSTGSGDYCEFSSSPLGLSPDMAVYYDEIVNDPRQPMPGEAVSTDFRVHNRGSLPVGGGTVSLLLNGEETESTLIDIDPGSYEDFRVDWIMPEEGFVKVKIVLDGENSISEVDESNNEAVRMAGVSRPRIYFLPSTLDFYKEGERKKTITDIADEYVGSEPDGSPSDTAAMVRYLALAFLLTGDESYAQTALGAFLVLDDPDPSWNDLDMSYILPGLAEGFDWLFAGGGFNPDDYQGIRERLLQYGRQAYRMLAYDEPEASHANGRIRLSGSLGLMSIALAPGTEDDDFAPDRWLEYVISDLFEVPAYTITTAYNDLGFRGPLVNHLISSDGAYCEGPGYQNYALKLLIKFLIAHDNLFSTEFACKGRVKKAFEWMIEIMMPDRLMPTFDTGWHQRSKSQYLLASCSENGAVHRWYWEELERPIGDRVDFFAFADLPSWPDSLSPSEAGWNPTVFIPEGGMAVMRSGWGEDDTYLLLMLDSIPCLSSHEQADQSSLLLFSHGEYLLIDPGDGRDYRATAGEEEKWMHSALAHNLVTLEGFSSPRMIHTFEYFQDPAVFSACFAGKNIDYAAIHMTHGLTGDIPAELIPEDEEIPQVESNRWILFPSDEYFIVVDEMQSHLQQNYEVRYHFAPGVEVDTYGNLTLSSKVREDGRKINLYVGIALPDVETEVRRGGTNYSPDHEVQDHSYIIARPTGDADRFITFLIPRYEDEGEPLIRRLQNETAEGAVLEYEGGFDVILLSRSDLAVDIARTKSDGEAVFVASTGGSASLVFLKNAAYVTIRETDIIHSDKRVTLSAGFHDDCINGYILTEDNADLSIYTGDLIPVSAFLDEEDIDFDALTEENRTVLHIPRSGNYSLCLQDGSGVMAVPGWPAPLPEDEEVVDIPKQKSGKGCGCEIIT